MLDRFIDKHPILLCVIVFAIIAAVVWIKMGIDEKKGINSEEKRKVHQILRNVISEYEIYTPVYAYWRGGTGGAVSCWYYAVGLTVDKMYIVPLAIEGREIGYNDVMIIQKDNLAQIDYGKPEGTIHTIKFVDKNQKNIFEMIVEESNTKLDSTYPVNIVQREETRAFMRNLAQWKREIM